MYVSSYSISESKSFKTEPFTSCSSRAFLDIIPISFQGQTCRGLVSSVWDLRARDTLAGQLEPQSIGLGSDVPLL